MPAEPEERPSLGFLLVRLGEAVDRHFLVALTELELRPRELRALVLLHRHPGCSQGELAQRLDVDPGNLVALLDRLESRGLLSRRSVPDDRRRRALQLTPAGARLLKRANAATQAAEDQVLARFDEDRRAKFEEIALDLWNAQITDEPLPER